MNRRTASGRVWKAVFTDTGVIVAAGFAVAGWGLFLLYVVAGVEINARSPTPPGVRTTEYLVGALVFTALGVPVAVFLGWRIFGLLRHGVEVVGTVTTHGRLSAQGWVRVNYAYEIDGRTYVGAASVQKLALDDFLPGATVTVIVHPRRPSRSILQALAYPDADRGGRDGIG